MYPNGFIQGKRCSTLDKSKDLGIINWKQSLDQYLREMFGKPGDFTVTGCLYENIVQTKEQIKADIPGIKAESIEKIMVNQHLQKQKLDDELKIKYSRMCAIIEATLNKTDLSRIHADSKYLDIRNEGNPLQLFNLILDVICNCKDKMSLQESSHQSWVDYWSYKMTKGHSLTDHKNVHEQMLSNIKANQALINKVRVRDGMAERVDMVPNETEQAIHYISTLSDYYNQYKTSKLNVTRGSKPLGVYPANMSIAVEEVSSYVIADNSKSSNARAIFNAHKDKDKESKSKKKNKNKGKSSKSSNNENGDDKKTSENNTSKRICFNYNKGSCKYGDDCKFLHEKDNDKNVHSAQLSNDDDDIDTSENNVFFSFMSDAKLSISDNDDCPGLVLDPEFEDDDDCPGLVLDSDNEDDDNVGKSIVDDDNDITVNVIQQELSQEYGNKDRMVYIDSLANTCFVKNKELLVNTRTEKFKINGVNGISSGNIIGELPGFGEAVFTPRAKFNGVSLKMLEERSVSIEWLPGESFNVIMNDDITLIFRYNDHNQSYGCLFDDETMSKLVESDKYSYTTLRENLTKYSKKQIKLANDARYLQKKLGYPSDQKLTQFVNSGAAINQKVTAGDIILSQQILGKDVASIKGKTKDLGPIAGYVNPTYSSNLGKQKLYVDIFHWESDDYIIGVLKPCHLLMVRKN